MKKPKRPTQRERQKERHVMALSDAYGRGMRDAKAEYEKTLHETDSRRRELQLIEQLFRDHSQVTEALARMLLGYQKNL